MFLFWYHLLPEQKLTAIRLAWLIENRMARLKMVKNILRGVRRKKGSFAQWNAFSVADPKPTAKKGYFWPPMSQPASWCQWYSWRDQPTGRRFTTHIQGRSKSAIYCGDVDSAVICLMNVSGEEARLSLSRASARASFEDAQC